MINIIQAILNNTFDFESTISGFNFDTKEFSKKIITNFIIDNKGIILQDSGEKIVEGEMPFKNQEEFSENIFTAMQQDNATIIFNESIAYGVNADIKAFISSAKETLNFARAMRRQGKPMPKNRPHEYTIDEITRSYNPVYVNNTLGDNPKYGSRTKLASSIACIMMNREFYYSSITSKLDMASEEFK